MRDLFYVPIIHTEADLGSLGQAVKRSVIETQGSKTWARQQEAVEAAWAGIRTELLALPRAWPTLRVYQDGLPVCNSEMLIVKDIAAKGSHNHRLLLELVEHGATLMGTEDPRLLVRDYQRLQRLLKLASAPMGQKVFEEIKLEGEELLHARDAFIAERIDSTLQPNETGILLIGRLHCVDELLSGRGICIHRVHTHFPAGAEPSPKSKGND